MANKILAVVVTYNRLELLKRCIISLTNQTYTNFDILIVNNGSTDGTKEWIDTLSDNIIKIHQENRGGAGGFHMGQKFGYDNGYDWIWMMNDDGVPTNNQLEVLKKVCDLYNLKFANPLVANIDNPNIFSLTGTPISDFNEGEFTEKMTCPFNGTFIHRSVIDKIGLIKPEMFIWGDEVEYRARARANGIPLYTIRDAIHLHPAMKITLKKVFPGLKWQVKVKPKHFSHYFYRNLGYFAHNYASKKVILADIISYSIYLLRTFQPKELMKFWKYYIKGINNDFSC